MGYFSWDCKGCGHSIREGHGWMSRAVVVGAGGDAASGSYDGYGRLTGSMGTVDVTDSTGRFAMWHRACYVLKGRPAFERPSRPASDQGTPPADELPEPQTVADLDAMSARADTRIIREREAWKRVLAQWEAEKTAQ